MDAAQEAANAESKSSAGDKYETTRAMMQIERGMSAGRLAEALKLKSELDQINATKIHAVVQPGSLTITSQGNFFIAISAGKLIIDQTEYFVVSPASPIGTKLRHAKVGDVLTFNGKELLVKEIW